MTLDAAMTLDATTAPFVGLRPFDRADHRWFKGRSREIVVLTRKVRGSRFTAVVGASGSGKSSLVRAGVLPELTGDGWTAIIAKPGSAPIAMLTDALAKAARDMDEDRLADARRYRFSANLRTSAFGLADLVRTIVPEAPRLVLVIDQFEELFRYGEEAQGAQKAAMQEESRAFVELLLTASAQADTRLHIIVTMRSDFFGNCSAYSGLAEAISESQYLVPLPGRDDLEEAIREPVKNAGSTIDDALVQRLLIDTEEQVDRLPTLQHTLRRLWDEAQGDPKHLREQDYKAVGGMAGSINRKAEQIREGLEAANSVDGVTLERVMKAITTLDDQGRATRRPQTREKLRDLLVSGASNTEKKELEQSLDRVIAALAKEDTSFLALGDSDDPEVDIGHEALIRSWCRLCGVDRDFRSGWLFEERGDGRQWRELVGRVEQKLLLSYTESRRTRNWIKERRIDRIWCARYGDAWEDVERLRVHSIKKSLVVGSIVLIVLGLVFSILAFELIRQTIVAQQKTKEARQQAEVARQQAEVARQQTEVARQFASASATTAAGYAKMLVRDGNARLGALVALDVPLKSPDPKVEAALSQALNMSIERFRLQGHEKEVFGVAFSLKRIVSASADNTLRLWDADTGAPVGQPLQGHKAEVTSVAISPDGRRIVSGSWDKTLRLWDASTGAPIGQPLQGHKGLVNGVAFSPNGRRIVSASADKMLRLWDADTGAPVGEPLQGHTAEVTSVAISPDGQRIVSGSVDNKLRLWDASTGKPIGQPLQGHENTVSGVAFSPDPESNRIVSGSWDKTLRLWDASTGAPIGQPMRGHEGQVLHVAISPDGRRIVSGSADYTLRLWDAYTRAPVGPPIRGHDGAVLHVAISPDGRRIVSGSADNTLRLWDAPMGTAAGQPLRAHKNEVTSVAISPDGRRIVSGSRDKTLRLWDLATVKPVGEPLKGHEAEVTSVAISPDGRRIVSGSADNMLRLWDADTGAPVGQPLRGHEKAVTSVAISPDGRRIVSGSADNMLRLWDADTGAPVGQPLRGHKGIVRSVAFSPDPKGNRIVSGSADNTLRLWDASTGASIDPPLQQKDQYDVTSVAFSKDGKLIASGSSDGALRLWSIDKLTLEGAPLRGHAETVRSVVFSPDGRRIVSGSRDRTLRVWDVATGAAIGQPLRGHEKAVNGVVFSFDGRKIVSGSDDNTLRVWDAGNLVATLEALVSSAKLLCPLSQNERQELGLSDQIVETQNKELTEAQRLACGQH